MFVGEMSASRAVIFVTGATGHVGRAVVGRLVHDGRPARVMSRDPRRLSGLGPEIEVVQADLDDVETLRVAMSGTTAMFLMAADEGTTQTANAVQAAAEAGIRHVVQLSSQGAGLEPMIAAGQYHLDRERVLQRSDLDWTILRCGLFMSNVLYWADSIRQDGTVRHSTGDGRFAPIDPADVGEVAAQALLRPGHAGKTYELTGNELLTTQDQVGTLARIVGKPIDCVEEAATEAAARMRQAGAPDSVVDSLIELWTITRAGVLAHRTDAVETILHRRPCMFEDWCHANADAFR
jgi:uncharacterized protein YbjT (DUF2867 family)